MILTVFLVFLGLTIALLLAGEYLEAPVLQIGGTGFLFLLGIVLLTGSLQYPTGEYSEQTYSYSGGNISQITQTMNTTYTSFDDEIVEGIDLNHVFGIVLSVLGVFGFMNIMFRLGYWRRNEN